MVKFSAIESVIEITVLKVLVSKVNEKTKIYT